MRELFERLGRRARQNCKACGGGILRQARDDAGQRVWRCANCDAVTPVQPRTPSPERQAAKDARRERNARTLRSLRDAPEEERGMQGLLQRLEEGAREAAHRTAITRRKPSAPVLWLEQHGLLKGRILDYGAGRGFDADHLGAAKYDPHFWPEKPEGKFDTIICNYVLNVVEPGDEAGILADIRGYLASGGHAYLAVRRDVAKEGFTRSGSFQRTVVLDLPPVFEAPGKFAIYELA